MKFFVDTADIAEIRELQDAGLIDGVTTNPSLVLKANRPLKELLKEICEVTDGPVSGEVASTDFDGMMREGKIIAAIAPNIVVKLPLTLDGLKACKRFTEDGIKTNVTLCFSANQALLAAKAGATYISPFVGRLDDMNIDGMELISDIRRIYDNYSIETEILAASIRTPNHVREAALIGADVATVPPATLKALVKHPLTDNGLKAFIADWAKTGQTIE
ncbi:fructose-6-phosphate aldolase [Aureimonas phyllosphaerae]|uniref:Probable transaldolase n=1 Tax=Aureimonas phyllosphaerae TaxID=1166078 RepID=A0A7W6BLA4_9HYPH|nr:fructose-6-phosphate aldolase [Aureimonas phyllosphaerae]MBB3934069.1 transaldolase [Aureimonas phyllosphaerae]MBB3958715.1 transaldolase [Aureimonas phyllosphaerae]SFF18337.1 transaldolase [Aureimonas phyllosphaerae]